MKKRCEHCGEQFDAGRATQRACSAECSNRATPRGLAHPDFVREVRALADRFWEKVDKNGPVHPVLGTRCWLWTGAVFVSSGYGLIGVESGGKRRHRRAHRVAWELVKGQPDALVLHRCDVKLCVNVEEHLYDGTYADNARDRVERGQQARGERHGSKTMPWRFGRRAGEERRAR